MLKIIGCMLLLSGLLIAAQGHAEASTADEVTARCAVLASGELAGKAIAQRFYGQAPRKSYFFGCSGGGIQAMFSAQRFPGDLTVPWP